MSLSSVCCVVLLLVTVAAFVTSSPAIERDNSGFLVVVDANPNLEGELNFKVENFTGWHNTIEEIPDSSDWQNTFGGQARVSNEVTDAPKPMELFSTSQLTAVPAKNVKNVIRYTIGQRKLHDRLVGHSSGGKKWPVAQDVTLTLRYPTNGEGAVVTYVEIIVNQSSNDGSAHVISGGIGQRSLTTVVVAKNTMWFGYTASIYGL